MRMPSAIIFVNDHTNTSTLALLATNEAPNPSAIATLGMQLEVDETIDLAEFNARVASNPNYPAVVHLNKLRVLVVLPTLQDETNRNLADIVLFVKGGLASVLKNNFGRPGLTLEVQRLNIWNLINGIRGSGHCNIPFPGFLPPPQTQTPQNPKPHYHHRKELEGMGVLERFGLKALEEDGIDEGVFGDQIEPGDHDKDDR